MTNISKYDVVVMRFPFASSLKYKARPAVVVSSDIYNLNSRDTLLISAISSQVSTKLVFEKEIVEWEEAGLLKPSIFKASVATIEREYIITKLGTLSASDARNLDAFLKEICK